MIRPYNEEMAIPKIIVRIRDQEADLVEGKNVIKTFRISTAANGVGCEVGSNCTPRGLLRVARKIGDGCAVGTVFRSRVTTGETWSAQAGNLLFGTKVDIVLTRILWLEGLEAQNANTLDRYVYLHGTNQEELLGKPVSHGCIRFSNKDIVEIYDLVPEGALVEIVD